MTGDSPLTLRAAEVVHHGWAHNGWAAGLALILWALAAALWPLAPARLRPALMLGLVAAGIPVLGWMTYCCGPAAGLVAFGLGVGLLTLRPLQPRPPVRRAAHPAVE